jgi:hypothetical protein
MCFSTRTEAKDFEGSQWQWRAGDIWIPYDLDSCGLLERAFQEKRVSRISLEHGYFAENPGYQVAFDRTRGRHVQLNTCSGGTRSVRRLAEDDPMLFETVSTLGASRGICSICQLDLEQEEASSGQVVKMIMCTGSEPHLFHRSCIFQWIKINVTCPYCKKSVIL